MRKVSLKLYIIACIIILSGVSVILFKDYFYQADADSNIYPATICDLSENSKKFDGKLVRIKAIHGGLGIDTPTFLTALDCDGKVWVTCKMDGNSCAQMYQQLRSIGGIKDPSALPQIDVVGRFKTDAELPQMLAGTESKRGKLLEIIELKGMETTRK